MNIKLKNNERIDDLEFKGLKIIQNKEGFCFGIDSVLLSDFSKEIKDNSIVLDLGTGTGILSILLSEKTKLKKIYGVEIQDEVADMAKDKMNDAKDMVITKVGEEKIDAAKDKVNEAVNTAKEKVTDAIHKVKNVTDEANDFDDDLFEEDIKTEDDVTVEDNDDIDDDLLTDELKDL